MKQECYISVDVEASGPIPGEYSMLSLGACCVDDLENGLLIELKPISSAADSEAMKVTGATLKEYEERGLDPREAMLGFGQWIASRVGDDAVPVFVGFNAPFDWSFINYYFHRFTGHNPFGFAGLDIKALYMGKWGTRWDETKSSLIAKRLGVQASGDHNPLHDAQFQAQLFNAIRGE